MMKLSVILLGIIILFMSCSQDSELNNWTLNMAILGSNSSPKCIDLNRDGVKDVVLGVGRNEFEYSKVGVLAVNGANGDTLWTVPAMDQVYGSPLFQDVNADDVPDVFITGRALNFMCINGSNGEVIWTYKLKSDDYTPEGLARFNFYNPTFVEDLNGDQLQDMLILNSGNVEAKPYDTINRHPGVLMFIDSKSGDIIALDTMPDGKESYMAPVIHDFNKDDEEEIIFGTGGETVSGSLYSVSKNDLLNNNLKNSRRIANFTNQHGFIAPSVVADFNNDGYNDLLALNHGGFVTLFDGKNNLEKLWQVLLPDIELNAQATIGYFNDDSNLDIFINGALGQWPKNTGSRQFFIDGADGAILKTYEIGCSGFSSPLSMNVDDDPEDEALLYINDFDCNRYNIMFNMTSMYIFGLDTMSQFANTSLFGKNISSTPWLGDLDNDNKLDLVSIVAENTQVFHEFMGFKVIRNEYEFNPTDKIKWGSYMEANNKCLYEE